MSLPFDALLLLTALLNSPQKLPPEIILLYWQNYAVSSTSYSTSI
jgi:hypothetical protein